MSLVLLAWLRQRGGAFTTTTHRRFGPGGSTRAVWGRALPTSNGRCAPRITKLSLSTATDIQQLEQKIKVKGDKIRQLKADGISKDSLAPHIEELLSLKAQLPESAKPKKEEPKKKEKAPKQQKKKKAPVEEMSESELRQARLDKATTMKGSGMEPFAFSYNPTRTAKELQNEYKERLENGEEDEAVDVSVAGRIMIRRVFGKLAFFTLQDETGTIQLQMDKKRLGDSFKVRCRFVGFLTSLLLPCPRFIVALAFLESQGLDGWW